MRIFSSIVLAAAAFSIGFLAQRSRMCLIAGLRDFILVRDGELLKGLFSFLATIWILSSLIYGFGIIEDGIPAPLFDDTRTEEAAADDTATEVAVTGVAMQAADTTETAAYEMRLRLVGTGIIASPFLWASIIGGFILGILTTAAGGCALRQHVLAAQGNGDAVFFLTGFFCMIVIYDLFFRGVVNEWF